MRKRILTSLCLLALCLSLIGSFCAYAASLGVDVQTSLTLRYQKDGKTFPNLEIGIYRVAEAKSDGTFQLIAPFSGYPVSIQHVTSQSQWQNVATTLSSYITAKDVAPDYKAVTDAEGIARFTGLKTGLYLVDGVLADTEDATYQFNRFMVYLPTPLQNGGYDYDVEATPKCTEFIPKTHYSVTVLWQDAGFQDSRPKSVTVDIYRAGVLYDTQVLSPENNWYYSWSVSEAPIARRAGSRANDGDWAVVQRQIPAVYTVTTVQNGNHFTIINTRQGDAPTPPEEPSTAPSESTTEPTTPDAPIEPPKTGDTFALLPIILLMCISGIGLVILAIYMRRRK